MDTETINDKKNKTYALLEEFFDEYNRIDSTRIQSRCENDLELRRLSDIIASQENEAKTRMKRIQELELGVQSKIKQNHEYETMINSLQEKLNVANEEKIEENKFNMVIIQANEMSQKDREIDRLNKVIKTLKEQSGGAWGVVLKDTTELKTEVKSDVSTIDKVMDALEMTLGDAEPADTIDDVDDADDADDADDPDDPDDADDVDEKSDNLGENLTDEDAEEEEEEEEDPRGELMIFAYHRKDYYMYASETPQKLYEKLADNTVGNVVGERKKNDKGKFKTVMHKK